MTCLWIIKKLGEVLSVSTLPNLDLFLINSYQTIDLKLKNILIKEGSILVSLSISNLNHHYHECQFMYFSFHVHAISFLNTCTWSMSTLREGHKCQFPSGLNLFLLPLKHLWVLPLYVGDSLMRFVLCML